jgi:GT2 family glycosyltransferase/glycosyltransferase involved in cell wall biosynthesis/SAM-dependent methyltransferase
MDYFWNDELQLWTREGFPGIAYSDGAEIENRIMDVIVKANDLSVFSLELINSIVDWPSEYHLSPARHCLLRPLGIKPGEKVLELGCGCGALTRYIGEIGAKVTAVEGSKTRALITAKRCRDLSNVKVILEDLLTFDTTTLYDWILLVGVLEYAPLFSNDGDPISNYLNHVGRFLSTQGRLVVAIENRLGLKYFNGCAEDHLGVPFLGIQGLYAKKSPVTFGRSELITYLSKSGFPNYHFFYPFPDYKLPKLVLSQSACTDPKFNSIDQLLRGYARDYNGSSFRLFDEALVFDSLSRNGLFQDFSNSFMVVVSRSNLSDDFPGSIAWSFATNRLPFFATQTNFINNERGIEVVKNYIGPKQIDYLLCQDEIRVEHHIGKNEYIAGYQLLWDVIKERAKGSNPSEIAHSLSPWFKFLLSLSKPGPSPCPEKNSKKLELKDFLISGKFVDCAPFNVILNKFGLKVIDQEWEILGEIELGWVVTRGVLFSLQVGLSSSNLTGNIEEIIKELCSISEILFSKNKINDWIKKEVLFQSLITGRKWEPPSLPFINNGLINVLDEIKNSHFLNDRFAQIIRASEIQISNLKTSLVERDTHIANLCQKISSLKESISRKKEITKTTFIPQLISPDLKNNVPKPGHVSLVIPVCNKLEYTIKCLRSLNNNTPHDLFDLIIVDNASIDGTQEFLDSAVDSISLITNMTNNGFTLACNQGAQVARGEFVLFLNNDTEPQPGWLEALVDVMKEDASIGIAGSKLVYPDGRLQEAGGIIFSDGSGWNYGRFDDPEHPRYNYVREVDYVSGASLLIRRSLLMELHYFDEKYSPGYYEDTDLCFQARRAGYKVVYCPFSRVIHHEGISSGNDLSRGMKKYQLINKKKFVKKWASVLKNQLPPDPKNVVLASARGVRSNILIIDPFMPIFDRASGSQRLFQIIRLLKKGGHHVTFIARNGLGQDSYVDLLEKMGVEVYATDPQMMRRLGYSTEGREVNLEELLRTRRYHYAVLSFYDIAIQYLPPIRTFSPDSKILIDTVDIHFLREARMAALENDKNLELKAQATQKVELSIYRQADAIITVTENDWQAVQDYLPGMPHIVIPNIHEILPNPEPFTARQGLLFVGNFNHTPNGDAVRYFVNEIFPLLKERIPEVTLTIVGNNPPEDLRKLSSPTLQVTGYVPSTLPYLIKARVAVVPLRFGAGMKGKVGEALAHGLPVVSTSIGVEGMGLTHGENILIADTPAEFARQIEDLYLNPTLWEKLSTRGQRKVGDHWSPEKVSKILTGIFPDRSELKAAFPKRIKEKEDLPRPPISSREKKVNQLSSIIIPAKDNWEYTRLCLDSLVLFADVPYELVIVDNGSSVSFWNQLKAWKGKNRDVRVKYVRSNKNLGFAGGCNQGVQVSAGDFIIFLNNDTVVTPGLFSALLKPLIETEAVGITGPVSNFVAGPQMISSDKRGFAGPDEADIEEIAEYANQISNRFRGRITPTNNLVGLCLALKKDVLQAIGGFDERFYPGNFEDVDFCIRAVQKGFKLMICQDAFLYHFGNRTFLNENGNYQKWLTVNLERFLKKWGLNGFKSENDLHEIPIANRTYPEEFFHYPITKEQMAYIYNFNGHSVFMGEVIKTYLENPFMWASKLIIPCNGQEPTEIQEKIETFMEEKGLKDNGDIVIFSGEFEEILEGLEGERCLIYAWDRDMDPLSIQDDLALIL